MASQIIPIGGNERVFLAEKLPLRTPFTVYIFPTTYCNFKCVYCAHSLGHAKMKEQYNFKPEMMDMKTFDNIVEQLKEFPEKIKVVSLTGQGEPLLNKNIPYMIQKLKEANVCERIEIISNGSLLTTETADNLIESGLDILRISLQGLSSQKYKEVCDYKLSFDEYLSQIEYYFNNKTEKNQIFVKVLDIALNEGEEEQFYKTFENITDRMFIEQCQPVYDNVELTDGLERDCDRYGNIREKRDICTICFYMLGIFPNGDVEPCDGIYKPIVLGNVNQISLKEMWDSKMLKEFWKMQLNRNRYNNPKCKVCCAPDDVTRPEDVLDNHAEKILMRI